MFLLGYDICDPKRLGRVHRRMLKYATPIQYSVFLLEGDRKALQPCIDAVLVLLDKKQDDFRIYELPKNGTQYRLGKKFLPDGILLTGLPLGLR